MKKISNQRAYALVCGFVLFCFGVFGFAFKNAFDINGVYLFFSILLGFWGMVVAFAKN